MNIYIICPVRKSKTEEREYLNDYVKNLRKEGKIVHYPFEVDQNTDEETICEIHREAMLNCDEVHVYWNSDSSGSHFDFGMAYALNKPIKYFNDIRKTNEKSYQNLLIDLNKKYNIHQKLENNIKEMYKKELDKRDIPNDAITILFVEERIGSDGENNVIVTIRENWEKLNFEDTFDAVSTLSNIETDINKKINRNIVWCREGFSLDI